MFNGNSAVKRMFSDTSAQVCRLSVVTFPFELCAFDVTTKRRQRSENRKYSQHGRCMVLAVTRYKQASASVSVLSETAERARVDQRRSVPLDDILDCLQPSVTWQPLPAIYHRGASRHSADSAYWSRS